MMIFKTENRVCSIKSLNVTYIISSGVRSIVRLGSGVGPDWRNTYLHKFQPLARLNKFSLALCYLLALALIQRNILVVSIKI